MLIKNNTLMFYNQLVNGDKHNTLMFYNQSVNVEPTSYVYNLSMHF